MTVYLSIEVDNPVVMGLMLVSHIFGNASVARMPYLKYCLDICLLKPPSIQYFHQPLKEQDGIRLLRVLAQPKDSRFPIQCDMIEASEESPPPYIALSHRWSESDETKDIIINGSRFSVSNNIYSFLLTQRQRNRHTLFGLIPSVSISQIAEKKPRKCS
jgi:hypothetical protein